MKSNEIIDLSYRIKEDMMVYPGLPHPDFQWLAVPGIDGNYTSQITMAAHIGTHIDSPKHFIPSGKSINELELQHFIGEALKVDIKSEPGSRVKLNDLQEALDKANEEIKPGDILIINTGIYHKFGQEEFARESPVPTEKFFEYVVNQEIACYGTDASAIDLFNSDKSPNHKLVLGKEVPIVENLTNLDRIEKSRFRFMALPLRIERSEGSPCRAIGIV